jgi:hypothetical protein
MPLEEIEPALPESEQPQTYALGRKPLGSAM